MQATKSAALRLDEATMAKRVQWLKAIREWQDEFLGHLSAVEFVECVVADLMGKSVFVFTPLGDLLRLPKVRPSCVLQQCAVLGCCVSYLQGPACSSCTSASCKLAIPQACPAGRARRWWTSATTCTPRWATRW